MEEMRFLFSANHHSEKLVTTVSASIDLRTEMETQDPEEPSSEQRKGEGSKIFTNHSDDQMTPNVFFTLNLLFVGQFVLTN